MPAEPGFLGFAEHVLADEGLAPAPHHKALITWLEEVAGGGCDRLTIMPPAISLNALPSTVTVNTAIPVSGMVSPSSSAVRVGISNSATVAPAAWINASVNNGTWSASLTPAAAGTIYIWAEQSAATSVQAISSAINVVVASLTLSAPGTGTAGTALTITGTVSPAADAVNVQLSTQNTAAPTSGWSSAVNTSGSYALSLTPASAGTYYAWAQDPATGLAAVSAAVTVTAAAALVLTINNPGGSYVHGTGTIPLNGGISPAQAAAAQVVLATSNSVAPTTRWQAASTIYNNTLWAIYYPTPAAAGSYYVWVETTTGGSQAVSSFTVTVT